MGLLSAMTISDFILRNIETLIAEWVAFAKTLPPGSTMTDEALRNDAERMLRFVAEDLETEQSASEARLKSQGRGAQLPAGQSSASHDHGLHRFNDLFSMPQMIAEYRALRASVIRGWLAQQSGSPTAQLSDLIRLNESIDQSIAESVSRFQVAVDRDRHFFNAMMTHDMRTPLQAIAVSAELIRRSDKPGSAQYDAAMLIAKSAGRLRAMVGDLADYALIRLGGNLLGRREPCNLGEIVRAIADEVRAAEPGHSITVATEGSSVGVWDRGRIGQMVSNLVGNAVQHGYQGSRIDVEVRGDDESAHLTVRNSGMPIPDARRHLIFEPYQQGAEARFENRQGSMGLGLYIAREIAAAHGGALELVASDENGTVFHAWVPKGGASGLKPPDEERRHSTA